ncbi:hypothetical protein C8R45DRAFT_941385 [Mycena sanguinolenta]|nr:hypothetical protein C8R45DRAFT_941385 [Mycena sanguinolenta]
MLNFACLLSSLLCPQLHLLLCYPLSRLCMQSSSESYQTGARGDIQSGSFLLMPVLQDVFTKQAELVVYCLGLQSVFLILDDEEESTLGKAVTAYAKLPGRDKDTHTQLEDVVQLASKRQACALNVGPFGLRKDGEAEIDDGFIVRLIYKRIPSLSTDAKKRPEIPDLTCPEPFFKALYCFTANIQDNFFELLKVNVETDNILHRYEKRELYFYSTVLRFLLLDATTVEMYSELYTSCVDCNAFKPALEDIVRDYTPVSELCSPLAPELIDDVFSVWLLSHQLSEAKKEEVRALRPQKHTADEEDMNMSFDLGFKKADLAPSTSCMLATPRTRTTLLQTFSCPQIPVIPDRLNPIELYNTQQSFESVAHAFLFCAHDRALTTNEQSWGSKLIQVLKGHSLRGHLVDLFAKAKFHPLTLVEMTVLRVTAGNDSDCAVHADRAWKDIVSPLDDPKTAEVKYKIHQLDGHSTGCSVLFEKIRKLPIHGTYRRDNQATSNRRDISIGDDGLCAGKAGKFLKCTTSAGNTLLAVLIVNHGNTIGVSHQAQVEQDIHAVTLAILIRDKYRVLLIFDCNILLRDHKHTKKSIDQYVLRTLANARADTHTPQFHSIWINEGERTNHRNICLELSMLKLVDIAQKGLDVWWEDGWVVSVTGFKQVEDE